MKVHQKEVEDRAKKIEMAKRQRKDFQKERIIINESIPKNSRNLMIKHLPHGYNSNAQFNLDQKDLIGKEWNTRELVQLNTKEKIVSQAGQEILPLSKSSQVKRKFF